MRAANRIEGCIYADPAPASCGKPAHSRDEVAGAIVDRRCAELLDDRHVGGRASADRLKAEMARQIEQRRADRARGANYEDSCSARKATVAGEHLIRGEIG